MILQDLQAKLTALEDKCKSLSSSKLWYLLLLVPIIVLKYRSFLIDLLVKDSKQITEDTTKKSEVLVQQENQANNQANKIISDADKAKADATGGDIPDNWYEKK
jgi:hypothetical protein